jgi:hypothetical protein
VTATHIALAVASLLAFSPVQACGVCNEDKVAATYDHAVVRRATLQGRVVVFCEVRGTFDSRQLKAAASRITGIDAVSLRTSTNPATVSFALDGSARNRTGDRAGAGQCNRAVAMTGSPLAFAAMTNGQRSARAPPGSPGAARRV